ncbi:hypothetical protein B0O99DRAFT_623567 [Bisporella sp. PMI_857]|nr:hypothetical protein B0O99DRAFT_623567 [Bisporella sp. PMI_857]
MLGKFSKVLSSKKGWFRGRQNQPTLAMDSGAVSKTSRGWCEWCIHAFNNLRPLEHISDTHAFGISVDRTVKEIRTSADGYQLCAMIYFNMNEASSSDQEQLQNKSMLAKMWHDTSKDFFTEDQLDEYRFDVICENRKASLQLTNLPREFCIRQMK